MLRYATLGTVALLLFVTPRLVADDDVAKPRWREQATQQVHDRRCKAVAFSPDGRWLATAGGGGSGDVKLRDAKSGEEVASWEAHSEETKTIVFSRDSRTLVTGGGIWNGPGSVALWDAASRKQIAAFSISDAGVVALAISPDGQRLAVGSGFVSGSRRPGSVLLWDLLNHREAGVTLQGHSGAVTALAYSPDGQNLVTSTLRSEPQSDRVIWELKTWDAETGKEGAVLETSHDQAENADLYHVRKVAFSPNGSRLAGGGRNGDAGMVKIWDVATGGSVRLPDHAQTVWSVAFMPGGKTLATADSAAGTIRFWNVADAREVGAVEAFPGAVFAMDFSPDGRRLVAAGSTGTRDGRTQTGIVKTWVRD